MNYSKFLTATRDCDAVVTRVEHVETKQEILGLIN